VALYKCEGIVLRVQPYGEADRLATLLTPDRGKLRVIAKGAQKGRGPLGAAVQPFVRARFVVWQGRQLDGISQADIVAPHRLLAADLGLLAAAGYCCDLADALTAERQEAPSAFRDLAAALDLLEGTVPPASAETPPAAAAGPSGSAAPLTAVVLRWLELHLLQEAGLQPELEACAACGRALGEPPARLRLSPAQGGVLCPSCGEGAAGEGVPLSRNALRALRYIAAAPASALTRVRVGPATMGEMDAALARHLAAVLQRPLKSRAFLDTLA
jgi:DNA repair protein RecO (recombination protein O)